MITLKQISFKEAMKMVEEGKSGELYISAVHGIVPVQFQKVSLGSLSKRIFFKKEKVGCDE